MASKFTGKFSRRASLLPRHHRIVQLEFQSAYHILQHVLALDLGLLKENQNDAGPRDGQNSAVK